MRLEDELSELEKMVSELTDVVGLRAIRSLVAGPNIRSSAAKFLVRHHNDQLPIHGLAAQLRHLKFALKEQKADREEVHRQVHLFALGGGTTLVVSSVLALLTPLLVYLPILLLPFGAGAYGAWRGSLAARRLALEISILNDILDALETLIETVQRAATDD